MKQLEMFPEVKLGDTIFPCIIVRHDEILGKTLVKVQNHFGFDETLWVWDWCVLKERGEKQ